MNVMSIIMRRAYKGKHKVDGLLEILHTDVTEKPSPSPMKQRQVSSCWKFLAYPAPIVASNIISAAIKKAGRLPMPSDKGTQRSAPKPMNNVGAVINVSIVHGFVF